MEASLDNQLSAAQTLDSSPAYATNPPAQIPPSDPQPTGDAIPVGEKRKRDQDVEEGPQSGNQSASSEPTLHPLWKTSLCSYFRRNSGSCTHGSACRYAHGEEELRLRPDNMWDPTSERAGKARKTENGANCEFRGEEEDGVLMTEMVDDDDGGGGGGDNSECVLDPSFSKCLVHLPRKWDSDNLRKFLEEQGVQFKSAKKKKGMILGFVRFESAEQLNIANEELEAKSIGNKSIKVADVLPRSYDGKIKSAMAAATNPALAGDSVTSNAVEDETNDDGSALGVKSSKAKSCRDVVTPLAYMSYAEQLEHKKNSLQQILKKLTKNARKACPKGISLPEWILKAREIGGLPCKLEGIIDAPLINGYRNKCEFSIGYSVQGRPTVGFMLGNFRAGVTAVEEPLDCPNVSRIACKYASIFQEFIQQSSFPVWNRFKNTGFWRQLTVREGRKPADVTGVENVEANISEVMLIIQVCSRGFDNAQITTEFERLAKSFVEGARGSSPSLPLTVLVVQDHQGISNCAPADALLRSLSIPISESGSEWDASNDVIEPRIHDYINNLRFSISPTAFFQVNTLAAEKLYSLAGDWANLGPDTLLFDICCGTGTIGLTLAHRVGMVVGIEMNASAVSDAHRNAEINGIKNCRFVCAKAEDVMGSLLKEYTSMPQKQDEHSHDPSSIDKDVITPDGKSIISPNDFSGSSHEPENGENVSGGSENVGEECQSCNVDDGKSSVPQFKNIVAIVDPPRVGLHPTVIKALRTHSHLKRLVYISCNPESLVANAIELCTPSPDKIEKGNKNNRGWRNMSSAGLARHRTKSMPISEPFRPVKAMAVDLFPHTQHCEMVMLLER